MNILEIKLFYWFNSFAFVYPFLDRLIVFCARYLGWFIFGAFLLFLVIPLFKKYKHLMSSHLELFFFALGSSLFARLIVKNSIVFLFPRLRPFESIQYVQQLIPAASGDSFPSGHAIFFFALATAIAFYYPRFSIFFFLGALVLSLARISAGVHWPTDVLAGVALGIATVLVCRMFWMRCKK